MREVIEHTLIEHIKEVAELRATKVDLIQVNPGVSEIVHNSEGHYAAFPIPIVVNKNLKRNEFYLLSETQAVKMGYFPLEEQDIPEVFDIYEELEKL